MALWLPVRFQTRVAPAELCGIFFIAITAVRWAWLGDEAKFIVAIVAVLVVIIAMRLTTRALSLWVTIGLVCHVTMGMACDAYSWPYFDDALHFVLLGSLTHLMIGFIQARLLWRGKPLSPYHLLQASVVFALGVGAAWELFEFLIDRSGFYQAQRGLVDTMFDLLADGADASVGCVGFLITQRGRTHQIPIHAIFLAERDHERFPGHWPTAPRVTVSIRGTRRRLSATPCSSFGTLSADTRAPRDGQ